MYDKFPEHEKTEAHRGCYLKWKNFLQSVMTVSGIYSPLQKQI